MPDGRVSDLFVSIQTHHDELIAVVDDLAHGPEREDRSPSERKKMSDRLIMLASRHEAAEEQYLWPSVRELVEGGAEMAMHAIEQESTAKRLLHDLDRISAGNVEFDTLVRQVSAEVHDHVTYEEATVLPSLRLRMSDSEVERLGALYDKAHRIGPTRPHPLTPPDSKLLKSAGPAIAAVDRARDLLTGRGR